MYLFQWLLDFLLLHVNEALGRGEKCSSRRLIVAAANTRTIRIGNLGIIKYVIIFSSFASPRLQAEGGAVKV